MEIWSRYNEFIFIKDPSENDQKVQEYENMVEQSKLPNDFKKNFLWVRRDVFKRVLLGTFSINTTKKEVDHGTEDIFFIGLERTNGRMKTNF